MEPPRPPHHAAPRYDSIGVGYRRVRRPDPRIARRLHRHLGDAPRVLNVGAGTGSYEPADRAVVALEPSGRMIAQRPAGAAPCVRGSAERLPFADGAFDAGLAVLTLHHWTDPAAGLAALRRVVVGPVVVLTFDADVSNRQWLVEEYFPTSSVLDASTPRPERVLDLLGGAGEIEVLPVPHDCTDGFAHAYWRRPEAYLDADARRGISLLARIDPDVVDDGIARLRSDLDSGAWARRHADLLGLEEIDAGYRVVVAH